MSPLTVDEYKALIASGQSFGILSRGSGCVVDKVGKERGRSAERKPRRVESGIPRPTPPVSDSSPKRLATMPQEARSPRRQYPPIPWLGLLLFALWLYAFLAGLR